MIFNLTSNARVLLVSTFMWNVGRTLPHAILVIFLLSRGISLFDIALIKTVHQVTKVVVELPSGIISDMIPRKRLYILSVFVLIFAFILIGFFSDNFIVLAIAYCLYGVGVSLRSGTLESDVICEYKEKNLDIRHYAVAESYVFGVSGIIGGGVGSVMYSYIGEYIYIVSSLLFVASIVSSMFFVPSVVIDGDSNLRYEGGALNEILAMFRVMFTSHTYVLILILICFSTIFVQSFYQYWQVLYKDAGVDVTYFGVVYIIFQFCDILGTFIYRYLRLSACAVVAILFAMALLYAVIFVCSKCLVVIFPVAIVLFYVYEQHLDVTIKRLAPTWGTSTYLSTIETVKGVIGICTLFVLSTAIDFYGVCASYMLVFSMFSLLSMVTYLMFRRGY